MLWPDSDASLQDLTLGFPMERINALPKPRQRAVIEVIEVIEAMLAQQAR
jgi:hypothetical protein